MSPVEAPRPPLPDAVLRIGMTGHRPNKLPTGELPALRLAIADLIKSIGASVRVAAAKHPRTLGGGVRLVLFSALAEGADRMAAETALAEGWQLQCPLPFARAEYEKDFADAASRAEFERLLTAAHATFEIDGRRGVDDSFSGGRAYESAGLVMLEASDLIIAVWDGKAAEGIGGTAVVVERALQEEVPILLVDPANPSAVRLLWTGFDPLPPASPRVESLLANAPSADTGLTPMIEALLAPPPNPTDSKCLEVYLSQRLPVGSSAVAYAWLVKLLEFGAGADAGRAAPKQGTDASWSQVMAAAPSDTRLAPQLEAKLRTAYRFADRLALHYANAYRSAFVFNYVAAAMAVAVALGGLFVHEASAKAVLVLVELVIIIAILVNTWSGQRRNVHTRWLDYRRLAERLRQMRLLAWSGASSRISRPVARENATSTERSDWVDWYARMVRRTLPLPNAAADAAYLDKCRNMLAEVELVGQINYHRRNATRMKRLDHRLHLIGDIFFWLGALTCVGYLAAFLLDRTLLTAGVAAVVTALSALLPTLGAATKAIRGHGDFKTIADRSAATAAELQQIAMAIDAQGTDERPFSVALLADRTEKASEAMLRDLLEWRLHSETRPLSLPA